MRYSRVVVIFVALFLQACAHPQAPSVGAAGGVVEPNSMIMTTLFCGVSSPDGKGVSEQQWEAFLRDYVTPRFPDGLTVLNAMGQWYDPEARSITSEHTKMLMIIHSGQQSASSKIEEVKAEYIRRFNQQSVLRTDAPIIGRFK